MKETELEEIKLNVNTLQKDIDTLSKYSIKFDDILIEIKELSNSMARMIAIHEQKHNQHEKDFERIFNTISKQEDNVNSEMKRIEDKIESEHNNLHSRITSSEQRIIKKVESLYGSSKKDSEKLHEKLEERLTKLERWRWGVVGAYGAIVVVVGLFLKLIPIIAML